MSNFISGKDGVAVIGEATSRRPVAATRKLKVAKDFKVDDVV